MSSVSTDDDAYYQNDRNNSRRKKRKSRDNDNESDNNINIALSLIENHMPREVEESFVCAIFELGLKKSSPKVLMSLMNKSNPQSGLGSRFGSKLSTEHIKSHLQKYRIHHERSKLEFLTYYNEHMRDNFHAWENMKG
jgi:SHAQKYF class myb-like DNA-binding protein